MIISVEQLQFDELQAFLREQADDAFPDLKEEQRLNKLAKKWHTYADFCSCRDDEGHLAGMIAFYANGKGAKFGYISHVYVVPRFRGKGVFKSMLHVVENEVRLKGYDEIRLEVHKDNSNALIVYEKNGFTEFGAVNKSSVYLKKTIL